jgi:thiol-disulfide isomerase/thioredoxin
MLIACALLILAAQAAAQPAAPVAVVAPPPAAALPRAAVSPPAALQDAPAGADTRGRRLTGGPWRAVLECPGGELPFGLELQRTPAWDGAPESDGDAWSAWLVNGAERIAVPQVGWRDGRLELSMPHYASRLSATPAPDGAALDGEWLLDRGGAVASMPFHARAGAAPRFAVVTATGANDDSHSSVSAPQGDAPARPSLSGRWSVQFAGDEDPAVGIFRQQPDGVASGTFLTTTGDYRYLDGDARAEAGAPVGSGLRLSCFDGAHAFLFIARQLPDGTLAGDFWSRDSAHDTFTARRDETAELPDAFDQVHWKEGARLDDVAFPDLDGVRRSLADPAFAGKARIVQVFGSWCPNCADEAAYLAELQRRYGAAGLSIVGLAFERTGDFEKDVVQVRRYVEHRGVTWPVLVAGRADKQAAAASLGLLDRIKSFPTTIFLHGDGRVAAVHSGYDGPATGDAHRAQRLRFEELVETLLAGNP